MIDRIRKFLEPARREQVLPATAASVAEVCDPIPEEHQLIIPLDGPSPLPNVTIQGRLGDNSRLVLDKRLSPNAKVTILAHGQPGAHKDVSISVGSIQAGRVSIVIAGSQVDLKVGASPRLFCKFGLGKKSVVRMGEGTTSSGFEVSCQEGRVTIGRDCQTADGSMIMGAQHHGIVDLSSGKPALRPQVPDVRVGDHVWLGFRCYIGGNAQIGNGSIVAAQSSVVSPMPANCLIAGNPAKVRRNNIGWSRVPHDLDPGSKAYFAQLKLEEQI